MSSLNSHPPKYPECINLGTSYYDVCHWSPPYPWIAEPKEFEKLLLEQEAARELLLACLSLEEQQHTGGACPEWYIQIHVDMVLLTWMVDFHPKISRYLYQSVMGNSNDNITKYEYVNSLVYQSETFAGVQKETPVGTGRTLWWKFCWVHRFCSVPKASFLLRNQWAFRSCQAQERRPGGSSISTRYGAPKRPKIHW